MLDRTIQPKLSPLGDFVLPVPEDSTFSNNIPVSVLNVGGQDIVRVDIVINAGKMHQEKLLVSYFTGMMLKEGKLLLNQLLSALIARIHHIERSQDIVVGHV